MTVRSPTPIVATTRLLTTLGVTVLLIAAVGGTATAATPRYLAINLGTLGGPNALPNTPGISISQNGTVFGSADTPALDPLAGDPACLETNPCHKADAFEWRDGVITDFGALGGYQSGLFETNDAGVAVGISETGLLDPLTGLPENHAVITRGDGLVDLGTLGGNESWANSINDQGQVAGWASNTTPDPDGYAQCCTGSATQVRAVIWQDGRVRDLGTLGGPDSIGSFINDNGQVAGESFTNSTVNGATGLPTMDPFLWQDGVMRDLGTLGGKFGYSNWLNSSGEVAGWSDLAGDETAHPFLWNGRRLIDLGTLGGANGFANWVNNAGVVVGIANTANQSLNGFLWTDGIMQDLPPTDSDPCSNAEAVNASDQVVGADFDCGGTGNNLNAMLWENGTAENLNNLVEPTPLHLVEAFYISDNGEIACVGALPDGDFRVVLVVPLTRRGAGATAQTSSANSVTTSANGTGATSSLTSPLDRPATEELPDSRDKFNGRLGDHVARLLTPGLS